MIHKGQFIIHGGGWACKNEWVGSRSIRKTRMRRAYQQWLANVIPRSLVSVLKTSLPGHLKLVNSLSHRNISKWNRYWNVSTFCSGYATFLSHGKKREVNISHVRTVPSQIFKLIFSTREKRLTTWRQVK